MRLKVLGGFGSEGQGQRPSAFLVDDAVLVDAGTVGGGLSVVEQLAVTHALISHAHLDHTVGLAFLADTLAMVSPERTVTACTIAPVVDTLRTHMFNDTLWPNFTTLPPQDPVLKLHVLPEETEARVGNLRVIPVPVDHTVPTAGFIVHDGDTGFAYTGDTGPTKRLWQVARDMRGLKALLVETAFPNRQEKLAQVSGHLTPTLLQREIDKMPVDVPIWIFHIKPQLYQETAEELARLDHPRIQLLEQGKTYQL
jgi:cAMP phosphodiesterase